MDKWRNKGKPAAAEAAASTFGEDSLLPPTRRVANIPNPLVQLPVQDRRSLKKWSIDAFFRKVSSILDNQTSSSSIEELSERRRRRFRGKSKGKASRSSGYAFKSGDVVDYSPAGIYRNNNNNNNNNSSIINNNNNNNNNNEEENVESVRNEDLINANMSQSQSLDALEARLASNSVYSRSSDGSLEGSGTRRLRKDKVKARVEAKRDQLCGDDSSMDESSADDLHGNGFLPKSESGKRRSRASRTERYLKRMGNGVNNVSSKSHLPIAGDHRHLLKERAAKTDAFQPVDRVPRSQTIGNGETSFVNEQTLDTKENLYAPQSDIGVNPLVQQTLQYFSEFDRHMTANQQQQKLRRTYPAQHQRRITHKSQVYPDRSRTFDNEPVHSTGLTPPKPPSRDHTSRVLINGAPMDKYQLMLKYAQKSPSENHFTSAGSRIDSSFAKHNSDVWNASHNPARHELSLSIHSPASSLKESLNMEAVGVTKSLIERNQSPILDLNQTKYRSQPSSPQDYHNPNYVPHKKLINPIEKQPIERRSSKNLEEALCELEAIYNSLQLGDEDLLERAEKRTMEEFHYKGFTASPDPLGNEDHTFRRKTWTDQTLDREEPEIPDRLKDDMAYRRMHPKERPSSTDGHSSLSSISYLMTSPIPSRREIRYIDPKRKSRRKEPDVTLDDVVFRSMQYANNTLKVVEPQPPFGIPLGPITAATESDYLHTNPAKSERSRSPYIPSYEPDLVTDDLAFRNLRKDAQQSASSRQPSPSLLHGSVAGSSNCTSPLSFGLKKKRAVRSLSANLYGLINKPSSPVELNSGDQTCTVNDSIFNEFFNDVPVKCISRRTSDPEILCNNWQTNTWDNLDVNSNKSKEEEKGQQNIQKQVTNCSDVDISDESCNESLDERISPQDRLSIAQRDNEQKSTISDIGSSYLSSNCSTPSASIQARSSEPFTEQEISVYKKLCQDLENLVQLTKSIDATSTCGETDVITISPARSSDLLDIDNKSSERSNEKSTSNNLFITENPSKSNLENVAKDDKSSNSKVATETSPVKREISMILDNLKSLREDYNSINSCCFIKESKTNDEEQKDTVVDDKSFKEITKEICDLVAQDEEEMHDVAMKVKKKESKVDASREDDERKDQVDDNLFFRNVQLAKLSGDWKESTPKNDDGSPITTSDRRTSLTGGDCISNWEGMTKCNHKYNSMPAKTSSLLPFRHYGSKRKSSNRKSMCTVS